MKKITQFSTLVAMLFVGTISFAQSTITGKVIDGDLDAPLPSANVIEKGTSNGTSTNFDGEFTLTTQSNSGALEISFVGYATVTIVFDGDTDLGSITLRPDNSLEEVIIIGSGVIDLAEDRQTPIAVSTITKSEIQAKGVGNVELPEIIKNTPSVFVGSQTGFGDGNIRLRGFDDTNTAVLLNGQPINAQEDGRVFWSNWAGIADIANAVQVQRGLGSSKLAISSVGGTINLVMRAADRNEGGFVRFMGGNDSYFKGTVSYDTGMNDKGWAFSILLDHWQGHRKWSRGTFGQGQNYYLGVGYKPNDTHAFNFLITGAPQFHGQKWSQPLDRISADPKFNQHWGFTEDVDSATGGYSTNIDSERRNFYHKPVANLNWDWTISDRTELSSVLYASWGRGGGTGPRGNGRIRTADPDGDGPLQGQLDYAAIEAQNAQIGVGGDFGAPLGAGYIRRASMNNHQWYGLVSNLNTELSENWDFNVGIDMRLYNGDHFRQVVDYYGLSGWSNDRPDGAVVTDSFEADPWAALFNFAPEDQRIDYDYSENINYQGLFSQVEYSDEKFSAFFQGAVSNQSYKRTGRFDTDTNGNQVTTESDKINKIGFNVKGGLGYIIGDEGMHKLFGNFGYYSRQPYLDNVFSNIRRSNDFVNPEVDNEDITGIELGYQLNAGAFKANVNFYYTDWANRVITRGGGSLDVNNTPDNENDDINVNFFDRGINQVHRGFELELFWDLNNDISFTGYVSNGSYEYKGTVSRDTFNDDTNELLSSEEANVDGVKITSVPQFTAGFGFRANVVAGLSLDGNINYYAGNYLDEIDFSTDIQTTNVGRVKPFSLIDLGLSYDFDLGGQDLTFRANVYNLLDEVRLQRTDVFGYIFTNGTTFNASVRYNF